MMSAWKQLPIEATAWIHTERYVALHRSRKRRKQPSQPCLAGSATTFSPALICDVPLNASEELQQQLTGLQLCSHCPCWSCATAETWQANVVVTRSQRPCPSS